MKLDIVLIRNGFTKGEQAGRYLGLMDEELDDTGSRELLGRQEQKIYPPVELVFSSPLLRCRETARILYPHTPAVIMRNLQPMDIGKFTGQMYHQIIRDELFSHWAEDEGLPPLGNGDRLYEFHARCTQAFRSIVTEMQEKGIASVAIITHRQVVGAILQKYVVPRRFYSTWQVECGGGYRLEFDTTSGTLRILASF